MSNLNSVVLSGRVTSDPVSRDLPSGNKVTTVRLASSRSYKKGDNWQEETTFIDCEAWGNLAQALFENTKKGTPLTVHGRLMTDEWEKDGEKRSKHKVSLDNFELNTPRAKREQANEQQAQAKPAPQGKGGFRSKNTGDVSEKAKDLPF